MAIANFAERLGRLRRERDKERRKLIKEIMSEMKDAPGLAGLMADYLHFQQNKIIDKATEPKRENYRGDAWIVFFGTILPKIQTFSLSREYGEKEVNYLIAEVLQRIADSERTAFWAALRSAESEKLRRNMRVERRSKNKRKN